MVALPCVLQGLHQDHRQHFGLPNLNSSSCHFEMMPRLARPPLDPLNCQRRPGIVSSNISHCRSCFSQSFRAPVDPFRLLMEIRSLFGSNLNSDALKRQHKQCPPILRLDFLKISGCSDMFSPSNFVPPSQQYPPPPTTLLAINPRERRYSQPFTPTVYESR